VTSSDEVTGDADPSTGSLTVSGPADDVPPLAALGTDRSRSGVTASTATHGRGQDDFHDPIRCPRPRLEERTVGSTRKEGSAVP